MAPVVDGFYHYRVSERIWDSSSIWYSIPWLPHTVLGESGPDHHWLWHLLISPITQLPNDDFTNLKMACAMTAAMVPAGLNVLMRVLNVPFAPVFAVLSIFSTYMLPGRLLMLKAQTIGLLLICFYLYAASNKKYIWSFLIAFIFMNTYHGAVILLPLTLLVFVVSGVVDKKWDVKAVIIVCGALALALVINPWYPESVGYLMYHVVYKMLFPVEGISVGDEWSKMPVRVFMTYGWIAHTAFVASVFVSVLYTVLQKKSPSKIVIIFVLSTLLMSVLAFFSNRFFEYYGPMAVLTFSLCMAYYVKNMKWVVGIVLISTGMLLYTQKLNMSVIRSSLVGNPRLFETIYTYLDTHANEGDMIFTGGWGNLPQHVWQSHKYRYVNGLDPNYLAKADAQKFSVWLNLRKGNFGSAADLPTIMSDVFGAKWAITSSGKMYSSLNSNEGAVFILTDENGASLFELKPK